MHADTSLNSFCLQAAHQKGKLGSMGFVARETTRRSFARRTIGGSAFLLLSGLGMGKYAHLARADSKVVRIGVQTLNVLRANGQLDRALAPLGVSVVWKDFPGGPQMLEALNVGAIDFAYTGEAPPIFAQAAGAPLLYVGAQPSAPKGEAIIVPQTSPVQSVAELKGKRVALNKGSNVHYLLIRALASVDLTPSDVRPVYLPPADARAAFEQGSVDAWAIWDPFLAAARAATDARVLVDGTGLVPNRQYLLASRHLAATQPDTVKTIVAELDKSDRWADKNRAEAARVLAPGMGLPVPIVETALDGFGFGVEPISPAIVADQQKMADTFASLGLIPAKIDVASAVWEQAS
jgi:sulfonate transport system substrate-binding protein